MSPKARSPNRRFLRRCRRKGSKAQLKGRRRRSRMPSRAPGVRGAYLVEGGSVVVHREGGILRLVDLSNHDDGDDDPVDGDGFAEDNADEVLGLDPGHFDG